MIPVAVGIDPGVSGGIAFIYSEGDWWQATPHKMPETERDIYDLLAGLPKHSFACIEKVAAHPKHGTIAGFKLGNSYGFLRGCLTALEIPFEAVPAGVWQRALGCLSKGDKNVTKAAAQRLYPKGKWTHATADAVLLAEYCRRLLIKREGTDGTIKERA